MQESEGRKEPLFVKVDGYKVILQELEAISQIIDNMREAIQVLGKVRDVKEKSINTFMENIERLNERLGNINTQLPEVEGDKYEETYEVEEESPINESVEELHGQLKDLKSELSDLE